MPPALLGVIEAVTLGVGLVETLSGMGKGKGGAPALPAPPPLPDPNKAQANAQDAITKQRQVLLATGGQTNYTGGTGLILGSDINKINLVGT